MYKEGSIFLGKKEKSYTCQDERNKYLEGIYITQSPVFYDKTSEEIYSNKI